MATYYDGAKLLSMRDLDGLKPDLYLCTTNRTGGKTTYFNRLAVNRFLSHKIRKFCLIYRFNYELDEISDKFFKDVQTLFFSDYEMTHEKIAKGIFCKLLLNGEECGYAITLNSADQIKKMSHLLSDVDMFIFDEFQSETDHYCSNEISKFISVYRSIARGNGEQARAVPVYMIGNAVSVLNPYFVALGISDRLREDTKFLKGHGYVLEQGYIKSAAEAQASTGFNRAFAGHDYIAYSEQNVYLNDSKAFIDTPEGKKRYQLTIKVDNREFGLWEYAELGIIFCGTKVDHTFPTKICVTTEDMQINYVMLQKHSFLIGALRELFNHGCFRFQNQSCKSAVMKLLSY